MDATIDRSEDCSKDRVLGALLGLATGDAVGTPGEFRLRGTFPEITGMEGGGAHKLQPGEWTDDTSLALCLAQSLIECQGHDPVDQSRRFLAWMDTGKLSSNGACFDIGNATAGALTRFRASGQSLPYCGSESEYAAGNGSLMRLAPVPMLLRLHPALAVAVAGESSRTTHAAPAAVDACRYFSALLVGTMQGASKELLLAKGVLCPRASRRTYGRGTMPCRATPCTLRWWKWCWERPTPSVSLLTMHSRRRSTPCPATSARTCWRGAYRMMATWCARWRRPSGRSDAPPPSGRGVCSSQTWGAMPIRWPRSMASWRAPTTGSVASPPPGWTGSP